MISLRKPWFPGLGRSEVVMIYLKYSAAMSTMNQLPHEHLKIAPAHWIAAWAPCFHLMVRPKLGTQVTDGTYMSYLLTLWQFKIAIEHHHLEWLVPSKMVISYYVKLPEGIYLHNGPRESQCSSQCMVQTYLGWQCCFHSVSCGSFSRKVLLQKRCLEKNSSAHVWLSCDWLNWIWNLAQELDKDR